MTTLLLDIGNTRLKWALCDENGFRFLGQESFSEDALRDVVKDNYDTIFVSNVRGVKTEECLRSLLQDDQTLHLAMSEAGKLNAYDIPRQLGVDRYLAMKAAWEQVKSACVVIDCGTVITLDCVDAEGHHLGGLIAPGLRMMRKALSLGTSALPEVTDSELLDENRFALNTVDGITLGTLRMTTGFIESQLRDKANVFLTGGDADIIASHLSFPVILDAHLVLKGLMLQS